MIRTGMFVKVTALDIKHSIRMSVTSCPVSLALRRTTKERYISTWGTGFATAQPTDDHRKEFRLPETARAFIQAFDAGEAVKPFMFKIGKRVV